MKLSRIKCTIVTMGFLATVLLLTFSTNTYPLPAKIPPSVTVKNVLNKTGQILNSPNGPQILLSEIFFTVCTSDKRQLAKSNLIYPHRDQKVFINSDDEYFSIAIHYAVEGGRGKIPHMFWVPYVHDGAFITVTNNYCMVSAYVKYY